MVEAAFLWGINLNLTNKPQSSSASQQETSSMRTKSQKCVKECKYGLYMKTVGIVRLFQLSNPIQN